MEYTIGTVVLDDWKIIELLGEGAYGKVFKIEKNNYGITTYSALKVIRVPQSSADIRAALSEGMDEKSVTSYFQGFVDEIVKEIAVMATVKSHQNIVGYEDHKVIEHVGGIGWDILIRMELLTPFLDYIIKNPLDEKETLRLGIELSDALAFCQKKGLIHRDIKPENIFISETGQYKLGDFGVSKTIEKTTGGLSKKGTESYMAPEVYLGKPYGSTVDIYSLGLVLYRLMNGNRLPFFPPAFRPITFADRENALIQRMRGTEMIPPANADEIFARVILKACEYLPENRYRTAAEFHAALRKVKNQQKHTDETVWGEGVFGGNYGAENTSGIFGDNFRTENTSGIFGDNFEAEKTSGIFGDELGEEKTSGIFGDEYGAEKTSGISKDNFGEEKTSGIFGDEYEAEKTSGIFGDDYGTEKTTGFFEEDFDIGKTKKKETIDINQFWRERLDKICRGYGKPFWGQEIPANFKSAIVKKANYGYLHGKPIGACSAPMKMLGIGMLVTNQEIVINVVTNGLNNNYGKLAIQYSEIKDVKVIQGSQGEHKLKILTQSNEIMLLSPDAGGLEVFDYELLQEQCH